MGHPSRHPQSCLASKSRRDIEFATLRLRTLNWLLSFAIAVAHYKAPLQKVGSLYRSLASPRESGIRRYDFQVQLPGQGLGSLSERLQTDSHGVIECRLGIPAQSLPEFTYTLEPARLKSSGWRIVFLFFQAPLQDVRWQRGISEQYCHRICQQSMLVFGPAIRTVTDPGGNQVRAIHSHGSGSGEHFVVSIGRAQRLSRC